MDALPLLAFGKFGQEARRALADAARQAAFEAEFAETGSEAQRWLGAHEARAVLVDERASGAEDVVVDTRADPRHAEIAILALGDRISDSSFGETYSWGVDDVVDVTEPRKLTARLRSLPREGRPAPSMGRGRALVADADRGRRVVLGRVLRNAGYVVTFAVTSEDARKFAGDALLDLVVASDELDAEHRGWATSARERGCRAPIIFTAAPRRVSTIRGELEGVEGVVVTDGFAPAENVLYLANEQRSGRGTDQRASARLLYGATVGFRGAGRESDDHGFSYNVSVGGLYVRTLAPPEEDQVWLELVPPRSERRVRLVGQAVWRRRFGPNENATVPPGFGVQIVDGAASDLALWRASYQSFAKALG